MKTNGTGSIYKRGNIFWVQVYVDGKAIVQSSKSSVKSDAVKLRNHLLGKKDKGELSGGSSKSVLVNELLDDVLRSDIQEPTRYIWKKVVEKNIRPFFGKLKAARVTTEHFERYREQRKAEGRADATVNRELSILRTAFHNGRKRSPPKVTAVPYFPMVKEGVVRKGFLSDDQYSALRDALPSELKALFVTAYLTGIRKGELLAIEWRQVNFEERMITLDRDETKGNQARSVPIVSGDMRDLLMAAKKECTQVRHVFNRSGVRITDFRTAWKKACAAANVPDLKFHDLRRTAVRNMRRAGIPQVIRMKISGHKTDSMERRYSIVDNEDLDNARELMGQRMRQKEAGGPS